MYAYPIRKPLILVAAATVLSMAACGSSSGNGESKKSGPQVATDAAAALRAAGAFHVTGSVADSGGKESIDLQIQGADVSGTLMSQGESVQLIVLKGQAYAKAATSFWTKSGVPAATAARINGKWVTLPSTSTSSFSEFSATGLANELQHPTSGGAIQSATRTATVNGKKVVVLTQKDGSEVNVSATGKAYPESISNKGQDSGTLTFSGYGKQQTISAPPAPLQVSGGA